MSVHLLDATKALDQIAPLSLAEEWDNVGLLIQPTRYRPVDRILLTIDLTTSVMDEAIATKAKLIVTYHPLIFDPIKRLRWGSAGTPLQRTILRAIESRIAVYSPHTALDAVEGGVNDWLCDGLGAGTRMPWRRASVQPQWAQLKFVTFVPADHVDRVRKALAGQGAGQIGRYTQCSFGVDGVGAFFGDASTNPAVGASGRLERVNEIRLEMVCGKDSLPNMIAALRAVHPYEEPAFDVYRLEPPPIPDMGAGRLLYLDRPVSIATLVKRIKAHLKLRHVRVATQRRLTDKVNEIGVCAGAGGSVFTGEGNEVYLTGEMRHHDVLAKVERQGTVILTDHTNTERGYLPVLRKKLHAKLGKAVKIDIARSDAEPLRIV